MFVADSDVTEMLPVETMRKADQNFLFDHNSSIRQAPKNDDLLYEEITPSFFSNTEVLI
jgi:hypothetical protein